MLRQPYYCTCRANITSDACGAGSCTIVQFTGRLIQPRANLLSFYVIASVGKTDSNTQTGLLMESSLPIPKYYHNYDYWFNMKKGSKTVYLHIGAPGPHCLKNVAEIMKISTMKHFDVSNPRNEELLQYGAASGDWNFKQELAKFLTKNYRKPVRSEDLFINAGISQGIANLLFHYFQDGGTVFVEDPTYWNFIRKFDDSFKMKMVAIPIDEDGIKVDELETQLQNLKTPEPTERYPYRSALYVLPAYQNPTGVNLSQERCKHLIEVARKYDLLVISDEVYNVMTYSAPDCDDPLLAKPPIRLFWHDNKSDPDYKGNVVSVGSVSKFLAPGLRVGWYEMPENMIKLFETHFITDSGSAWNQYTSGILAWAFHLGLVQDHIMKVRKRNTRIFHELYNMITNRIGKLGVKCSLPSGGSFLWITLPEGYSTDRLAEICKDDLTFVTGTQCSIHKAFENCLRVCVCFYDDDVLLPAVAKLCDYIEKFITE